MEGKCLPRSATMKFLTVVVLLVSATILGAAAVPSTGPFGPHRPTSLADVVRKMTGKDHELALRIAAGKIMSSSGSRVFGCYEPGCITQCQFYGYPTGVCRRGECYCWYP